MVGGKNSQFSVRSQYKFLCEYLIEDRNKKKLESEASSENQSVYVAGET